MSETLQCCTNSATHIRMGLLRSLKDEQALLTARDRLLTQPFSPTFTHPIFDDSEQVKGYKDLRIELDFASGSLRSLLKINHTYQAADADDILTPLKEHLHDHTLDSVDFKRIVEEDAATFTPCGNHIASVHSSQLPRKDQCKKRKLSAAADAEVVDVSYEMYKTDMTTPGFIDYLRRMEIFTLLFIDGATYIDLDDDLWRFVTIFEKRKLSDSSITYHFVGYTSLYPFYLFPDRIRLRLSQFIILPPYQRQGIGKVLFQKVYEDILADEHVHELVVEDPVEGFDAMRDSADYDYFLQHDVIPAQSQAPVSKKWVEDTRRRIKMGSHQFAHMLEIVLYSRLSSSDGEAKKAYRLYVKERLYRFNFECLAKVTKEDRMAELQKTYVNVTEGYRSFLDTK